MQTDTLAIDFGTSNSAAAVPYAGGIYRIPIEQGQETLPTAVFFPREGREMLIGSAAGAALIARDEGRYMRALKSVLGLPLLHESRLIGGKRQSIAQIITAFLALMKQRAEAGTGLTFTRALSGRPVHFHSNDPSKDAQAEADLRACYLAAGFGAVEFLAEPEAAAMASHALGGGAGLGLIVDIGGGTSDFSLFRSTGGRPEIIASHGIRLGGTDFDHAISMRHAMPMLGLGTELRRAMGSGLLPVPRAPYVELSTWPKIPFLYTPDTRRLAADMLRYAVDAPALSRFKTVIEDELGHELAFAVERGKIAANAARANAQIGMEFIAPALTCPISEASLSAALDDSRHALREAVLETLRLGNAGAEAVSRVILVGGSSLMRVVSDEMQNLLPQASLHRSEAFTAVVDGLAIASQR